MSIISHRQKLLGDPYLLTSTSRFPKVIDRPCRRQWKGKIHAAWLPLPERSNKQRRDVQVGFKS
jgi:hypothetical protein